MHRHLLALLCGLALAGCLEHMPWSNPEPSPLEIRSQIRSRILDGLKAERVRVAQRKRDAESELERAEAVARLEEIDAELARIEAERADARASAAQETERARSGPLETADEASERRAGMLGACRATHDPCRSSSECGPKRCSLSCVKPPRSEIGTCR